MKSLLTIIFAVLIYGSAFSESKRMVFVEEYTSGYCTPCYDFDKAFFLIGNQYQNDVIPISIHSGNEPKDNMYRANTLAGDRFAYAYDTLSINTPAIWVNGTRVEAAQYASQLGSFTGEMSPITIYLIDDRSQNGMINLKAIVHSDDILTGNNKLVLFVREETVYDPNPESGMPYVSEWENFNWVAREILPTNTGQSISITKEGAYATIQSSVNIKADWDMDNIKTFAIVQNMDTKEVLQAAWALDDLSDIKPKISADNSTLQFGDIADVSEKTVTLINTGPGDLTITGMAVTDDSKGYFSLIDEMDKDIVLKPGREKRVDVEFFPKETGNFGAKLIVTSDADNTSEYTIQLEGSASNLVEFAQISFSNDELDFGEVSKDKTLDLIIQNIGTGDLSITQMDYTDNDENAYSIGGELTFPLTIASEGSLSIPVIFTPKSDDYFFSDLNIYSDSKAESETYVSLSGLGVNIGEKSEITIVIDGSNEGENILDFGESLAGERKSFDIENTGNVDIMINTLILKNDDADLFELISDEYLINISEGAKHEVVVEFNPTESGTFTTDLEITYGDDNLIEIVKITASADFSSISDELSSSGAIKYTINPNPASDEARFEYTLGKMVSGNISFKLYDINGGYIANLHSSRALGGSGSSFSIDASKLSSGKYFIIINLMGKAERIPLLINK